MSIGAMLIKFPVNIFTKSLGPALIAAGFVNLVWYLGGWAISNFNFGKAK
jgi:hypothetical protein